MNLKQMHLNYSFEERIISNYSNRMRNSSYYRIKAEAVLL